MADLPSTQRPGESLDSRPLSGAALAGFSLSALFALILVVGTLVALVQGSPFFLTDWTLALAAAGAVVSFLGLRHVQNSEGTRAGLALARWGLWLSVFLGLGYFAYNYVTGLALVKQANDFLMEATDADSGFFPRLQKAGKDRTSFYQAYLLTLPFTNRGGSNPADEKLMLFVHDQPGPKGEPGKISIFRKSPLVETLPQFGDQATIEPLGVKEWKYQNKAYVVVRHYRIKTLESVQEITLPVKSSEGAPGEPRRWFLSLLEAPAPTVQATPLGLGLRTLRNVARNHAERWLIGINDGKACPEFKEADTSWDDLLPQNQRQHVNYLKTKVVEFFRGSASPLKLACSYREGFTPWEQAGERLRITMPLTLLGVLVPAQGQLLSFNLEGEVVLETKEAADLSPLPSRPPTWEMSQVFEHLPSQPPTWEVRKVRFFRASAIGKS